MSLRELGNGALVVPPDDGRASWFMGHLYDTVANAQTTGGAYSVTRIEIAPLPLVGAPPHVHAESDEAFYILEGVLRVRVGDETLDAEPGTFLFVPKGTLHGFDNPGRSPARALVIVSPPGFEEFFHEAGEPAAYRGVPDEPGRVDIERITEIARRYATDVLGPGDGH